MLVRTPELAVGMEDELGVRGKAIVGRYAPLTATNVKQLLLQE